MKKTLSSLLLIFIFFLEISPLSAIAIQLANTAEESNTLGGYVSPDYPDGERIQRLKEIVDTYFSVQQKKSYRSNCIASGWLCPNSLYNSVIEKAIKYIVLDTYEGNETFYKSLFVNTTSYNTSTSIGNPIEKILIYVPKGVSLFPEKMFFQGNGYRSDVTSQLLSASFGVDFRENANKNSLLGAIEQKITDVKRQKCQQASPTDSSYTRCPWNGEISNQYLPTENELMEETIFLNGTSVEILSIKDDFEYQINVVNNSGAVIIPAYPDASTVDNLAEIARSELVQLWNNSLTSTGIVPSISPVDFDRYYIEPLSQIRSSQDETILEKLRSLIVANISNPANPSNQRLFLGQIQKEIAYYEDQIAKNRPQYTYTLKYKKDSFTLEEARAELEKNIEIQSGAIIFSNISQRSGLPCSTSVNSGVRSECSRATANLNTVMTALGAYYSDREQYPDSIDALNTNYLPKQNVLEEFKKNFEYSRPGLMDFEIVYIGKIGEGVSIATSEKKDYLALMNGATVPPIPKIFNHVPRDAIALYIKNPENLLSILSSQSNTSTRLSGIDPSQSVKNALKGFFEIEDFTLIEKHLKNEFILVVENLDLTVPDITMILSEEDRESLSPTAKARVIGSKDGLIFVANSKETIDRFINLDPKMSLSDAPDFQYVWWKKSSIIRDAFFFVGDEFFEKMIELETYIAHYRRYREFARLTSLQELAWSYSEAFGEEPKNMGEILSRIGNISDIEVQEDMYTLTDGLISTSSLGNLKSPRTLSESMSDLGKITRSEFEDYKFNVLKYRDVWRANLDPLGIVLNRYGDGMEIDFFMTPVPTFSSSELGELQNIFQGVTKDSLSFLENPNIRMGLLSFVFGFDPKKFQNSIEKNEDIEQGFSEISGELLDGKSIFDYLAGEFAFTLGNFPSDIFEGWNIDKLDASISIQVTSEEKGKEFIDLLRSKIINEFGEGESSSLGDLSKLLAKPLIEDYAGRKIFYVEAIPVPFIGKISLAYTFVDDFFFLAPNRATLYRVLDIASKTDTRKIAITDTLTAEKGTFLLTLFDGVSASDDFRSLYEKNKSKLPRLTREFSGGGDETLGLLSSYQAKSYKDGKLGKVIYPFSYSLGGLRIDTLSGSLRVTMDREKYMNLTGTTRTLWEEVIGDETFPKEIFSSEGIPLDIFLSNLKVVDILGIDFIVQMDDSFASSDSLFRNTTFALHLGDNEIGFVFRVFRNKDTKENEDSPVSPLSPQSENTKQLLFIGIIMILLLGVGGGAYAIIRKKRSTEGSHMSMPTKPPAPSIPMAVDGAPPLFVQKTEEVTLDIGKKLP